MKEPTKPVKKIVIEGSSVFYDLDFTCSKIALQHFLDWCKSTLPPKAKDVCIGMDEDIYYNDNGDIDGGNSHLILSWKQMVTNKQYDKDMKKYKKKLTKWKKENK